MDTRAKNAADYVDSININPDLSLDIYRAARWLTDWYRECARKNDALLAEVARYRELYETERSRRTLGGTPLRVNEVEWTNTKLETPEPGAKF